MTIMSLISLGVCLYNGFIPTKILWILTIIGVFITIISFFMAIFMGLKIHYAKKAGKWFINILSKFHILKNNEESYLRWTNKCDEYNISFKILLKDKTFIVKCIFLNILYMTIFCMIPFFVFKALDINIRDVLERTLEKYKIRMSTLEKIKVNDFFGAKCDVIERALAYSKKI